MQAIFDLYKWDIKSCKALHQGLINQTFDIVTKDNSEFILQTINHQIFKQSSNIDYNIRLISQFILQHHPSYIFTHLVPNVHGDTITTLNNRYYRAFKKLPGHALNVLENTTQAEEAAKAFGNFTSLLSPLPIEQLKISLPQFHDLTLRYHQFEEALQKGDSNRITACKDAIAYLQDQKKIVTQYQLFTQSKEVKKRVTHHDTKISNVLFDTTDKAICVIDLDTVMPGYFISDVGDMCRTYLCKVSEEEKKDFLLDRSSRDYTEYNFFLANYKKIDKEIKYERHN